MEKARAEKLFALINEALAKRENVIEIDKDDSEISIKGGEVPFITPCINILGENNTPVPLEADDAIDTLVTTVDLELLADRTAHTPPSFWQQFLPSIPLPITVCLLEDEIHDILLFDDYDELLRGQYIFNVAFGPSIACLTNDCFELETFLPENTLRQIWDDSAAC